MKTLLRSFVFHAFVIWFLAANIGGIHYGNDPKILLLAALALTFVDMLIKPVINLLILPFNLITLGTFRWVSSVFTLYLTTLLVPGFAIVAFTYPGLNAGFIIIPAITLSLLGAYIALSVLSSLLVSFIYWLVD
jgi:putative membrane protein